MGRLILLCVLLCSPALAQNYYVDATLGSDGNPGTLTAPYRTLSAALTRLSPGGTVFLKRGETWNERALIAESGTATAPITIDAYGVGDPPTIDGTRKLNESDWTADAAANLWVTTVASVATGHQITLELDGAGGNPKSDKAALSAPGDYFASGATLYLYAPARPSQVWADARVWERNCIELGTSSYVTIRHVRCQRWRLYGLYAAGTNAGIHIEYSEFWFGNPLRTQDGGMGIRLSGGDTTITNVTVSAPGLYGLRAQGTVTVSNSIFVGASQSGLSRVSGTLTYDHCAIVGNGGGPWALEKETEGDPIDGGGNLTFGLRDVLPFANPGLVTMMSDDGDDSYWAWLSAVMDEFEKRRCPGFGSCPFGIAMMAGRASFANYQPRAPKHDLISHTWSHIYANSDFDGTDDLGVTIRYVGAGSAATLTISANGVPRKLTTTVTGGPGGENLDLNLHAPAYDTISELCTYINGRTGSYTCSRTTLANATCHSTGFNSVVSADIKTVAVTTYLNQERTERDELRSSAAWIRSLYNDPTREVVLAWPGGERNSRADSWVKDAGITACLGTEQRGDVFWGDWPDGCLPRFSIKRFHGLSNFLPIAQRVALYSATNGGRSAILFEHPPTTGWMTAAEMGRFLDALLAAGVQYSTPSAIALDWQHAKKRPMVYARLTPAAGSVLIDAGAAWAGMPASDAAGNPILGRPDIGAYEFQTGTSQ